MPLSALATVELQLICHFLEQSSWLSLARCSRFTHAAASDPFAARHFSAVTVDISPPAPPEPVEPLSNKETLLGVFCCGWKPARLKLSQPEPLPPSAPSVAVPAVALFHRSLLRHAPATLLWQPVSFDSDLFSATLPSLLQMKHIGSLIYRGRDWDLSRLLAW